jgi:tetratricopeptide (TPR) repeat protein
MRPNINPSTPPRFHELGEFVFQELCRDVFEIQGGIVTCEIYGRRGQPQKGIDLLANCDDGESNEVGQCKAYTSFSAKQIVAASDEFFKYWDHWKDMGIRRFILFVGCPLDHPEVQNEIQAQRARFKKVNITYEAWGSRTLVTRLRPQRAIAQRHIPSQEIVDSICGKEFDSGIKPPVTPGIDLTLSLLGAQLEDFAAQFSDVAGEKLERARELSREGKIDDAYRQILQMRNDKTWHLLANTIRGRVLRFNASLILNAEKNISEAKELRDQAAALDPTGDDVSLRAVIRYFEEGNDAALQELATPTNINAFNLKIGFLTELGRADDALAVIERLPVTVKPDADTLRLHALLLLLKGDQAGAQEKVEKAFEQNADWLSVRHAYGIVNYFSALSPVALPKRLISSPAPVPWALVKRDPQSQERLRKAESQFARLAEEAEHNREQHNVFNLWRLACLANDVQRQEEAAHFCRMRLARTQADSHTLAWAHSRNYDLDLRAMEESLERSLGVDQSDNSY